VACPFSILARDVISIWIQDLAGTDRRVSGSSWKIMLLSVDTVSGCELYLALQCDGRNAYEKDCSGLYVIVHIVCCLECFARGQMCLCSPQHSELRLEGCIIWPPLYQLQHRTECRSMFYYQLLGISEIITHRKV
jgi:hypothetical protein